MNSGEEVGAVGTAIPARAGGEQDGGFNRVRIGLLVAGLAAVTLLSADQIAWLWSAWLEKEEYSHGLLMPLVSLYLLWERRKQLAGVVMRYSWTGVALLVFSLVMYTIGSLAHLEVVKNHAFIMMLASVIFSVGGFPLFKKTLFPLFLLFLVVPLPSLLNTMLTTELQLLSSKIGVAVIRFAGVPVHLEGNVIDMGTYRLLVVEACSGLRYMFPLISIGFIVAYFYRGPMWHRFVLVISTIPITIFTNSFRIGVTGILVEYFGKGIADGFLHDFEGWLIFMFASALLVVEVVLLLRLSGSRMSLAEAFGQDGRMEEATAALAGGSDSLERRARSSPAPAVSAVILLLVFIAYASAVDLGRNIVPERMQFSDFPAVVGEWEAERRYLPIETLEVLDATDYYIGTFHEGDGNSVELYMAYHALQQNGSALHNPEVCIPGGGWEIHDLQRVVLETPHGPINALRMEIGYLRERQLLYYWFQQQGRTFNDENVARAALLLSAIEAQRTDSSLVRVRTSLRGDDAAHEEAVLRAFINDVFPHINGFIPD